MKCRETQPLHALRQQWLAMSGLWGASVDARLQVFNRLVASYTAANRHYHGIGHIQHMLALAGELQTVIGNQQAFYFAIWFHDAVQLAGKDSEGLSASLACKELEALDVPATLISKVIELILMTKHHVGRGDGDVALFLDIDLSILAGSQSQYQTYARGCRKEYPIPNFIYRRGRKKFLRSLMKRAFIFNTDLFRKEKEDIARGNIKWELQGL